MATPKITALFGLLLICACSTTQQTTQPIDDESCGVERWNVKNLQDADTILIDFTPRQTSIAALDTIARVKPSQTAPRLERERQVVSVTATITAIKREDDGDIHILLRDTAGNEMIAELPTCSTLKSGHVAEFQSAYEWLISHVGKPTSGFKYYEVPATITGVVFQDFSHGQRSEAPNSVEIHPVLSIQ